MKSGLYQHYKGNFYQVMGISRHSETLEELVVYQALYGDFRLWVRPKALFESNVTVNNVEMPRFKFIRPSFENPPNIR